ncbi:MAG TPA: exodeoxyribonuclease VII large subunit [Bacteroidales bacterium]|nr:exodeoxyribonuclease VII large subunit [Bacteroidales bacterium]
MNDKVSLAELQVIIRDSLYLAFPGFYWVTAEISDLRENISGHCYLELIEKQADDVNLKAKARAVIWGSRYRFVKHLFEGATGELLRPGLKILVQVRIEYHELYGLSLVINDIDPSFTLGEMAIRRQQILRKLEEEGVISMNRDIEFPLLPKRVAVISSKSAAGYADFTKHLNENTFGYRFNIALFESAMQGDETETGIISALDRIAENQDLFDVVCIVRGGGAVSDLSWFDNYNIAFHVTQFPLPVITGIGHEKDRSVTDIVAHRAEKTPTSVADFLIGTMAATEEYIAGLYNDISTLSRSLTDEARINLDAFLMRLLPSASIRINREKDRISGSLLRLANTGKSFVIRESMKPAAMLSRLMSSSRNFRSGLELHINSFHELLKSGTSSYLKQNLDNVEKLGNNLKLLSPENILRRGYTITSRRGRIVTSAGLLKQGDKIHTTFSDGTVESSVSGPGDS